MKMKELAFTGMFVALALSLSYVERFFPLQLLIPLPGVKLGLANIVTMMALYFMNAKMAFFILIIRCFMGSMFGGGMTGLAMSLTGGIIALTVMAIVRRIPFLSIYGVSVLGAAAHNFGQVCAAATLMYSGYTFAYLPFLLLMAVPAGMITGTIAAYTFRALGCASAKLEFI